MIFFGVPRFWETSIYHTVRDISHLTGGYKEFRQVSAVPIISSGLFSGLWLSLGPQKAHGWAEVWSRLEVVATWTWVGLPSARLVRWVLPSAMAPSGPEVRLKKGSRPSRNPSLYPSSPRVKRAPTPRRPCEMSEESFFPRFFAEVGGLDFLNVSISWEESSQLTLICFRGVGTTNQRKNACDGCGIRGLHSGGWGWWWRCGGWVAGSGFRFGASGVKRGISVASITNNYMKQDVTLCYMTWYDMYSRDSVKDSFLIGSNCPLYMTWLTPFMSHDPCIPFPLGALEVEEAG